MVRGILSLHMSAAENGVVYNVLIPLSVVGIAIHQVHLLDNAPEPMPYTPAMNLRSEAWDLYLRHATKNPYSTVSLAELAVNSKDDSDDDAVTRVPRASE